MIDRATTQDNFSHATTLRDPITRGFYLATISHCMECHGRRPDGAQDYRNALGFRHRTWTDAEIKRVLTRGVARDGRAFQQPMARQIYFSRMIDADLDAIVAWLRTIPPIE